MKVYIVQATALSAEVVAELLGKMWRVHAKDVEVLMHMVDDKTATVKLDNDELYIFVQA